MAESLRLADGVNRSAGHRASTPRPADQGRRTSSSISDRDLARLTKANLFVVGDADSVARFVVWLTPSLSTPVVVRHNGEPLRLPSIDGEAGTLVVHDVDTLTPREQRELSQWIAAANGRSRVVSTASISLLPPVATGLFDAELYYRLNVLTLDLNAPLGR